MTDPPARRRTGRRPAEVARAVTLGASGAFTFGLVAYFGLSERPAPAGPPEPTQPASVPASSLTADPATVAPTTAVPLTTVLADAVPTGPRPAPAPAVTVAPTPATVPADVVTERSR